MWLSFCWPKINAKAAGQISFKLSQYLYLYGQNRFIQSYLENFQKSTLSLLPHVLISQLPPLPYYLITAENYLWRFWLLL